MVGIELGKNVARLRGWPLALALITAAVSVWTNMAIGFAVGLALVWLLTWRWPDLLAKGNQ